jgi:hypothetical protein
MPKGIMRRSRKAARCRFEPMNVDDAKAQYRAAWAAYLLASEREERRVFEQLMDEAQPFIATCPNDPAWPAFIKTLPGFESFWARFKAEGERAIRRR